MVDETNRYATALVQEGLFTPHCRMHDWVPTNPAEIRAFIGLLIVMGIVHKPTLHEYWSTEALIETPLFPKTMSRNRFQMLLRNFHVADNSRAVIDETTGKPKDRLYKVRPILNVFEKRMTALCDPDKELDLDESMMGFRGRVGFRQYIKNKAHKYGIKFYTLCEAKTSMILRVMLYCGKDDEMAGKGHANQVVMYLMADKLNNGHSLIMDNFYNSVALAEHLLLNDTHLTGTMRSNLVCCTDIRAKKFTNKDRGTDHCIIARTTTTAGGDVQVNKFKLRALL